MKCSYELASGAGCKREAQEGSQWCWQHPSGEVKSRAKGRTPPKKVTSSKKGKPKVSSAKKVAKAKKPKISKKSKKSGRNTLKMWDLFITPADGKGAKVYTNVTEDRLPEVLWSFSNDTDLILSSMAAPEALPSLLSGGGKVTVKGKRGNITFELVVPSKEMETSSY